VLCGASLGSLRLQADSQLWLVLRSVPCPGFCISSVNTGVGFSGMNFDLFTSMDIPESWAGQRLFPGLARPTRCRCEAAMPGAGEEAQGCSVPKLRISTNKKAKEIAACAL